MSQKREEKSLILSAVCLRPPWGKPSKGRMLLMEKLSSSMGNDIWKFIKEMMLPKIQWA